MLRPVQRLALASVLVPLAILAPSFAQAQTAPSRAQVRALLSGIEHTPSDADWRRVGEGALPILLDLYNDTREVPYVRLRAVGATAAFPRPAVRTFLLAVARADGQNDLMVREAVSALGRGFGATATSELIAFLDHDEEVVREVAARWLGRIGESEGTRALRARLTVERNASVRQVIERALR